MLKIGTLIFVFSLGYTHLCFCCDNVDTTPLVGGEKALQIRLCGWSRIVTVLFGFVEL